MPTDNNKKNRNGNPRDLYQPIHRLRNSCFTIQLRSPSRIYITPNLIYITFYGKPNLEPFLQFRSFKSIIPYQPTKAFFKKRRTKTKSTFKINYNLVIIA